MPSSSTPPGAAGWWQILPQRAGWLSHRSSRGRRECCLATSATLVAGPQRCRATSPQHSASRQEEEEEEAEEEEGKEEEGAEEGKEVHTAN